MACLDCAHVWEKRNGSEIPSSCALLYVGKPSIDNINSNHFPLFLFALIRFCSIPCKMIAIGYPYYFSSPQVSHKSVLETLLVSFVSWLFGESNEVANNNSLPEHIRRQQQQPPPPPQVKRQESYGGIYNASYGNWTYVVFVFNILSMVLSLIIMTIVITTAIKRRDIAVKTSFRISGSIAVIDVIMSSCLIVRIFDTFMTNRSQMELRVLLWINNFTAVAFMFLIDCIVLQLQLTVLHKLKKLAKRLDPFYEIVSILLAMVLTDPYLYFYEVYWDKATQGIRHVTTTPNKAADWGFFLAWMLIGWLYCLSVCLMIALKLFPLWNRMRRFPMFSVLQTPMNNNNLGSSITGTEGSGNRDVYDNYTSKPTTTTRQAFRRRLSTVATPEQRRHARNAILRMMLYPLIPIITRSIYVVCQIFSISNPPFIPIMVLQSSQGILNFVAFALNPALDECWSHIFGWIRHPSRRRVQQLNFQLQKPHHHHHPSSLQRHKTNTVTVELIELDELQL